MAKSKSTPVLYKFLDYNYAIFPITLAAMFLGQYSKAVTTGCNLLSSTPGCFQLAHATGLYEAVVSADDEWNYKTVLYAVFTLLLNIAEMPPYSRIWGLCLPMRPFKYAHAPSVRVFRDLKVCLVTKGSNVKVCLIIKHGQYSRRVSWLLRTLELTTSRLWKIPYERG